MQSQFLTMNETEPRCEEALQSKFCELRNELWRAESLRTMTLARLQTVQTELNLKRARSPGSPATCTSRRDRREVHGTQVRRDLPKTVRRADAGAPSSCPKAVGRDGS